MHMNFSSLIETYLKYLSPFLSFKIKSDKRRCVEYTLSPRVEDQRPHIMINEFS